LIFYLQNATTFLETCGVVAKNVLTTRESELAAFIKFWRTRLYQLNTSKWKYYIKTQCESFKRRYDKKNSS